MINFSRFYNNVIGQAVEVSSVSAPMQCLDGAYLWIFCNNVPKVTIQHGSAYQVFTNPNAETKKYFDIIPNTPTFVPKTGDLGVYGQGVGPHGHIGICTGEGDVNTFKMFEQNWSGKKYMRVNTHNYKSFLGVLRLKNV